jgi:hypothetical protein
MNRPGPVRAGGVLFCLALLAPVPAAGAQPRQRLPENPQNAAEAQKPVLLSIALADGAVTADIADCPLHDVLVELAARTGVIFEVRSEPNPLVSVHLRAVPLPEAVGRIVPEGNIVFIHDEADPGRIALVRILPRDGAAVQPGLLYFGTGRVTASGRSTGAPAP